MNPIYTLEVMYATAMVQISEKDNYQINHHRLWKEIAPPRVSPKSFGDLVDKIGTFILSSQNTYFGKRIIYRVTEEENGGRAVFLPTYPEDTPLDFSVYTSDLWWVYQNPLHTQVEDKEPVRFAYAQSPALLNNPDMYGNTLDLASLESVRKAIVQMAKCEDMDKVDFLTAPEKVYFWRVGQSKFYFINLVHDIYSEYRWIDFPTLPTYLLNVNNKEVVYNAT